MGTETVVDRDDLERILGCATSQKNSMLHRGGVSPCQLVFDPSLAPDLLTDDASQDMANQELQEPSGDTDTAAHEFRHTARIQDKVRKRLSERESTNKLREAGRRSTHQGRRFTQGQWVYGRCEGTGWVFSATVGLDQA